MYSAKNNILKTKGTVKLDGHVARKMQNKYEETRFLNRGQEIIESCRNICDGITGDIFSFKI